MNPDKFTFIDLFAGIGGIRLAFEAVNGQCVWASENNDHARQVYQANFGDYPAGDITQIPSADIPEHDVLLAGFPCQAFSIIGDKKGFADTRGTLFFEIERILKDKQPHAFLLENVRQLSSHDKGRTFTVIKKRLIDAGYFIHWKILNALHFGLPQKRERTFIVGIRKNYPFRFPAGNKKPVSLDSILEPDDQVDEKWFASGYIQEKRQQTVIDKEVFYPSVWHENKGGNVSVLPFSCALRASASFSYLLVNGRRRLTPVEMLRLQGFPDDFVIEGTETQIRQRLGNSVPVPVVRAVAQKMLDAIHQGEVEQIESVENPVYRQETLLFKDGS